MGNSRMLDISATTKDSFFIADDMKCLTRMLAHCIEAQPGHFVKKIHSGKSGPYYHPDTARHVSSDALRVGAVASLVCFERDGEKWRYECARGSRDASAILTRLHAIRYALHDRAKDIALLDVTQRAKNMTISTSSVREFALMSLALDAIEDPRLRREVIAISGIDRMSEDVVGDAQYACENYEDHMTNIAQ